VKRLLALLTVALFAFAGVADARLSVTNLHMGKSAAAGGGPVTVSHLGSAAHANASSVTVNVSPGAAASDRFIVVFGMLVSNLSSTIDSATVDGNTATAIAGQRGSGGNTGTVRGFYYLLPAGTANIDCVVTFSGATEGGAISVYSVTGHGTTWAGVEFGDTNSNPLQSDGTQDVAADGAILAAAGSFTNPAYTWDFGGTTPTEDVDATQSNLQYSTASHPFTSAQTNITIEADQTPENRNAMQGVILDPA
jgi:hypothetical protein